MTISAVLCAVLPAFYLAWIGAGWIGWVAALLLSQIPASILAITLVHWIVTRITEPCVLPKLDSERGIPAEFPVTVTVPVVIARQEEVDALKRQMEMHWLANTDPALQVALLADLADAPEETLPGDHAIVEALESAVEDLNERYGSRGIGPFHLLMRPRLFNPQQGCWMAWERKRGKLEQFNRLIVEGDGAPFTIRVGDRIALDATRFVLTLDADTILPSGSVAKLAGTLAHPLNRPAMTREGRLQRGYSIIQPRVEISPASGERTLFARLFTGETAIDIYSRAVSDVYQDLFGVRHLRRQGDLRPRRLPCCSGWEGPGERDPEPRSLRGCAGQGRAGDGHRALRGVPRHVSALCAAPPSVDTRRLAAASMADAQSAGH